MTAEEGRLRAGIVFRWLESGDTFRVPAGADFLLGQPEDGVIRSLSLPDDALAKIYRSNFIRLVGPSPRPLQVGRAREECARLSSIAEALSGSPAAGTEAARVMAELK
jgi:hypothetical protein